MKINGITLNLNMADADEAKRFEQAISDVVEKMNSISNELSHAEMLREQCHVLFDCFNELFGEGTDKKLFGDKTDLLVCMKVYRELILKANLEKEKVQQEIQKIGEEFKAKQ